MRGGSAAVAQGNDSAPTGGSKVTALASHGASARVGDAMEGAVALKQEVSHDLSPTEKLEQLQWSKSGTAQTAGPLQGRAPRGSQGQGLRRRDVLGVRQLHAGAEWHVHEVRYLRQHDGVLANAPPTAYGLASEREHPQRCRDVAFSQSFARPATRKEICRNRSTRSSLSKILERFRRACHRYCGCGSQLWKFSAHRITDQTTLQIIDVEPHEAELLCLDVQTAYSTTTTCDPNRHSE